MNDAAAAAIASIAAAWTIKHVWCATLAHRRAQAAADRKATATSKGDTR